MAVTSTIFTSTINEELLTQAVRVYLSNRRQGTAKTKTRGEINRTKQKWFRQKGTGNARHGARTPNIFVGGGVSHGPTGTQNYDLKLSSKMKKQAMLSALAVQKEKVYLEDKVMTVTGKTKDAVVLLGKKLTDDKRILIVVNDMKPEIIRSFNNLTPVLLVHASRVSALEVLNADEILLTKEALQVLEERLVVSKKITVKEAPVKAPTKSTPASVTKKVEKAPVVKKPTVKKTATKGSATSKKASADKK